LISRTFNDYEWQASSLRLFPQPILHIAQHVSGRLHFDGGVLPEFFNQTDLTKRWMVS